MHGKPYSYRGFFIKQWAEYVITHDDWSQLHARFLNAQVRNAKQVKLTKEQVAKMRASKTS
jgi:hypothetical protein